MKKENRILAEQLGIADEGNIVEEADLEEKEGMDTWPELMKP